MERDPRAMIAEAPMSAIQIAAVLITIALNGLDGFDVLAISFASPGIAAEWGIDRAALGVVLSMELIGMAIGSVLLGSATDRFGRRRLILVCLCIMAAGMFLTTAVSGIVELSLVRVFTGLGIGGMLAATNATVAEHSNARTRNLSVSLMAIGYPIGAVLGGLVAAQLLKGSDWRSIFIFGGATTLAFLPIAWLILPETIPFLCEKRPVGALDRVNKILVRMGLEPVSELPPLGERPARRSTGEIFRPGLAATTLLVTLAYFSHIATFYFILKWVPKIVVDMGFAPSAAAGVLVWANVGGAAGGALLGLAARRLPLTTVTIAALIGSVLMVSLFGHGQSDLGRLSLIVGIAGFFTNAGVVGLYAIFAQVFPTHVRATGTGFAIGVGRGGAALSPIFAGLLFASGIGQQKVAMVMACGAAVAAVALLLLPRSATPTDRADRNQAGKARSLQMECSGG